MNFDDFTVRELLNRMSEELAAKGVFITSILVFPTVFRELKPSCEEVDRKNQILILPYSKCKVRRS